MSVRGGRKIPIGNKKLLHGSEGGLPFDLSASKVLGPDKVKQAGGDAEMMYLPMAGIKGNSHILMQDRNNLDLADLLLTWIDKHVESKQAQKATVKR